MRGVHERGAGEPDAARLQREVDELRRKLFEAQETIRAIQGGEVDAVVITDADQPRVYTLDAVDKPYRLAVEQMRQGAATLTVEGTILYCNDRFSQLLRRPQARLVGRRLHEFVEAAGHPLLAALLRDGLAAGVEGELMLRRSDGSRVPLFLGFSALREGAAGVCLIVADLTEQKRRERLVADEALARSILEQVADAVVVCDDEGVILRASSAAHELCGCNPLMCRFADVFPLGPRRSERPGEQPLPVDIGAAWRGEALRGLEVSFVRPNGRRADLLLSAGPLLVAGGELRGAVITLTDITPLQEADRHKDEFLAMLAHELRNPLSPIRSSLEVMQLRELDDPHLRKSRDIICRQVQHLTRLVDDLLEVSRISSGKIELRLERIDLARAVERAVETNRPAIDAKHHRLIVALPAAPVPVLADVTRVSQVVGNLLNNAAKYTEDGGTITVQAALEGGEGVIRVRDTGIGIPADMLSRVFDLFTQINRSLDRAQGGLGIGLALVKRLVAMHGGSVEARSDGPGRGCEFIVRLPAADAVAAAEPAGAPQPAPAGRRVLVVDDNRDAAESMAALLQLLGHDVRVATDGPSAIARAVESRPDIVLCDIGLPLMDGYQVVAELRARPGFAATRFVALTGYGREEDMKRSRAAGFDAHLVKPADLATLTAVLGGAK
jgi:PAS domain S-box-containing protein